MSALGGGFVELLARTTFSFREGASQPDEMVRDAYEKGMPALGVCDRDGIYGLPRALGEAKRIGEEQKSGEYPVLVGAELTLERDGAPHGSIALLAKDQDGYAALCRLLTQAHATHEKGTAGIDIEAVAKEARGLVAIAPLERDLERDGGREISVIREAFGEDAFAAVFCRKQPSDRRRMRAAISLERGGLPVIASSRPLYHHPSRRPLADVLACIRLKTTLDEAGTRIAGNSERFLRTEHEMRTIYRDHPGWIDRTLDVAARCHFRLSEIRYRFPGEIACQPNETPDQALRRCVERGCLVRYPGGVPDPVRATIEKELALIEKIGVAPYFLSVREVIEMARRRGILCQGRGSAANSAVCYVLEITAVDPARSNLLFERFLSAERNEPPDIDVDFEHERREEVIQEIYSTWGRDRAAMVSEAICYRGRSALREVGKVFGLAKDQLDRLSGLVLHLDPEGRSGSRMREMGLDPDDHRVAQVMVLARQLEGIPRHLSIHVGGFILSSESLDRVAPIEPGRMADRTVIPWDKDDLDTLGFFKIDVLGLGMLTAIRKALQMVHERSRPDVSFDPLHALNAIPAEDPKVYAAIQKADTIGVFQIESRAQMTMLPRLKPATYYDLVIEVAIVRPGPIQGGMVHPYLRRRTGKEKAEPPHPCLQPILARTLGVPLFQEQVMQISMVGANYTPGEADQLRRDMAAWRRNGRLARHRDKLLAGFAINGIPPAFAEQLYKQIHGFAEYGFPESHAASFALLVYASSWLKVHHPAAFACALLDSQPMGFYSPSSIVQDAQRHGVVVLPADVTISHYDSTLEGEAPAIRLGLREIKSIGEKVGKAIVEARGARPFEGLNDFVVRAGIAQRDLDILAEAGALASLESDRRRAMWQAHAPRAPGLFARVALEEGAPPTPLPSITKYEQLVLDYQRVGYSVDDHPMRHHRANLKAQGVSTAEAIKRAKSGKRVKAAGLVVGRQRPDTKVGVTFITLEDETGFSNLVVWRDVFDEFWHVARHAGAMVVEGRVQSEEGVVHVMVEKLERLELEGDVAVRSRDFH